MSDYADPADLRKRVAKLLAEPFDLEAEIARLERAHVEVAKQIEEIRAFVAEERKLPVVLAEESHRNLWLRVLSVIAFGLFAVLTGTIIGVFISLPEWLRLLGYAP